MNSLLMKLKRTGLMTLAMLAVGVSLLVVGGYGSVVYADAKADVCAGIAATGGGSCTTTATPLNNALRFAIQTLSAIAGIIGVVMIIVSGIKYMTSQGDGGQINSAKNSLVYAIVGLVVASLAQVLVRFILFKAK